MLSCKRTECVSEVVDADKDRVSKEPRKVWKPLEVPEGAASPCLIEGVGGLLLLPGCVGSRAPPPGTLETKANRKPFCSAVLWLPLFVRAHNFLSSLENSGSSSAVGKNVWRLLWLKNARRGGMWALISLNLIENSASSSPAGSQRLKLGWMSFLLRYSQMGSLLTGLDLCVCQQTLLYRIKGLAFHEEMRIACRF